MMIIVVGLVVVVVAMGGFIIFMARRQRPQQANTDSIPRYPPDHPGSETPTDRSAHKEARAHEAYRPHGPALPDTPHVFISVIRLFYTFTCIRSYHDAYS